jgi:hypothetical protein
MAVTGHAWQHCAALRKSICRLTDIPLLTT